MPNLDQLIILRKHWAKLSGFKLSPAVLQVTSCKYHTDGAKFVIAPRKLQYGLHFLFHFMCHRWHLGQHFQEITERYLPKKYMLAHKPFKHGAFSFSALECTSPLCPIHRASRLRGRGVLAPSGAHMVYTNSDTFLGFNSPGRQRAGVMHVCPIPFTHKLVGVSNRRQPAVFTSLLKFLIKKINTDIATLKNTTRILFSVTVKNALPN